MGQEGEGGSRRYTRRHPDCVTVRVGPTTAVLLVAALAGACTSSAAESCESAAFAQAAAEEQWAELLEEHVHADEVLATNPTSQDALAAHDDSADRLFDARVTMILAEAETRARCG